MKNNCIMLKKERIKCELADSFSVNDKIIVYYKMENEMDENCPLCNHYVEPLKEIVLAYKENSSKIWFAPHIKTISKIPRLVEELFVLCPYYKEREKEILQNLPKVLEVTQNPEALDILKKLPQDVLAMTIGNTDIDSIEIAGYLAFIQEMFGDTDNPSAITRKLFLEYLCLKKGVTKKEISDYLGK